jgi:undecaprenyl-diphosphatase
MGAGLLALYKEHDSLVGCGLGRNRVGIVTAFISALLVIRALIRYVSKHDFTIFAWYRIVFGLLILLTSWTGWIQW